MKLLHHIEQELFERGVSGSLSNLLVDIAEEAEPTHDAEGAEESPPRFGEPAAFEREAIASPPPSAVASPIPSTTTTTPVVPGRQFGGLASPETSGGVRHVESPIHLSSPSTSNGSSIQGTPEKQVGSGGGENESEQSPLAESPSILDAAMIAFREERSRLASARKFNKQKKFIQDREAVLNLAERRKSYAQLLAKKTEKSRKKAKKAAKKKAEAGENDPHQQTTKSNPWKGGGTAKASTAATAKRGNVLEHANGNKVAPKLGHQTPRKAPQRLKAPVQQSTNGKRSAEKEAKNREGSVQKLKTRPRNQPLPKQEKPAPSSSASSSASSASSAGSSAVNGKAKRSLQLSQEPRKEALIPTNEESKSLPLPPPPPCEPEARAADLKPVVNERDLTDKAVPHHQDPRDSPAKSDEVEPAGESGEDQTRSGQMPSQSNHAPNPPDERRDQLPGPGEIPPAPTVVPEEPKGVEEPLEIAPEEKTEEEHPISQIGPAEAKASESVHEKQIAGPITDGLDYREGASDPLEAPAHVNDSEVVTMQEEVIEEGKGAEEKKEIDSEAAPKVDCSGEETVEILETCSPVSVKIVAGEKGSEISVEIQAKSAPTEAAHDLQIEVEVPKSTVELEKDLGTGAVEAEVKAEEKGTKAPALEEPKAEQVTVETDPEASAVRSDAEADLSPPSPAATSEEDSDFIQDDDSVSDSSDDLPFPVHALSSVSDPLLHPFAGAARSLTITELPSLETNNPLSEWIRPMSAHNGVSAWGGTPSPPSSPTGCLPSRGSGSRLFDDFPLPQGAAHEGIQAESPRKIDANYAAIYDKFDEIFGRFIGEEKLSQGRPFSGRRASVSGKQRPPSAARRAQQARVSYTDQDLLDFLERQRGSLYRWLKGIRGRSLGKPPDGLFGRDGEGGKEGEEASRVGTRMVYKVTDDRPEVYKLVTASFHSIGEWHEDSCDHESGETPHGNILWSWSSKPKVNRQELNIWQRVNHYPGANQLTRKDILKKNLANCKSLFKPNRTMYKLFDIMPLTFSLPQEYVHFCNAFSEAISFEKPSVDAKGRSPSQRSITGAGTRGS